MLACQLQAGEGGLLCAIDMHAHAGKRGCFIYGNAVPDLAAQAETLLFPRLIALHTPHFDVEASSFSAANMASADATEEVRARGRPWMSAIGGGRVCVHVCAVAAAQPAVEPRHLPRCLAGC
jgi:hypothetical protein